MFFLFFPHLFFCGGDQGVEKFKAEALTYFHQSFGHLIDFVQRKVHAQHFSVVGLVVVIILKDREKMISYVFFFSPFPPQQLPDPWLYKRRATRIVLQRVEYA